MGWSEGSMPEALSTSCFGYKFAFVPSCGLVGVDLSTTRGRLTHNSPDSLCIRRLGSAPAAAYARGARPSLHAFQPFDLQAGSSLTRTALPWRP